MSILLDHSAPLFFYRALKEWGYDALLQRDLLDVRATDMSVLQLAQTLDSVLLTTDRDFSDTKLYNPKDFQGIIVIRESDRVKEVLLKYLQESLDNHYRDGLRQVLVTVTPSGYRLIPEKP